ncbi:MAG: phytanoyl-CoA dioxygenase family protein, partial [Nocardioidaceae bacterium]
RRRAMPKLPDPNLLDRFERDGFVVIPDAIDPRLRLRLRQVSQSLLASPLTQGRDRGADGKDGFRGCLKLDDAFLPLVANPRILPTVVALLTPNIHLLASHLIALPSIPRSGQRTIRTPKRPGWHRDMYRVANDLGHDVVPRMAIKCAYYLTDPGATTGTTTFPPGSHTLPKPTVIPSGTIDPPGAVTPEIGPGDAILFENRTWHAGGLNCSAAARLALMMQYGYRWLAPVDDPNPEIASRPGLTEVERQLLGRRRLASQRCRRRRAAQMVGRADKHHRLRMGCHPEAMAAGK